MQRGPGDTSPLRLARLRRWPPGTVRGAVTDVPPLVPGSGRRLGSHGDRGARSPPAALATRRRPDHSGEGAHLPVRGAPGLNTGARRAGTRETGEGAGRAQGKFREVDRGSRGGEGSSRRSASGAGAGARPRDAGEEGTKDSQGGSPGPGARKPRRGRREVTREARARGHVGVSVGRLPLQERRGPWLPPAPLGPLRPSGFCSFATT